MSELDNIIQQTISLQAARVSQAGFGTPLVLDYHTRYSSNLVREYSELSDMVDDGFATTDPAYKAASKIAAQDPGPASWKIGRRTHGTSQKFEWTPVTAVSTLYAFGLAVTGGADQLISFTSSATATSAEILLGLTARLAAANAYAAAGLTAATASGKVTLTGPATGPKFEVFIYDDLTKYTPTAFSLLQDTTADNNIESDFNACLAEDDDFYGVMSTSKGAAELKLLSATIETLRKFLVIASMDNDIISTSTSDIATYNQGQSYNRTAGLFNDRHMQHPDAALLGRWLPYTPGSETVKFKVLTGITPTKLTSTYRAKLRLKNFNFFNTVAGLNIVEDGICATGEFMDTIRYDDWLYANIQQDVLALLASMPKVPFTDTGIAQVGGAVQNVLTRGEQNGGGVKGSSVVNLPAASSISTADRVSRFLNKITWSQDLAGAVHSASIEGRLVE
jgi:hypothetical protein